MNIIASFQNAVAQFVTSEAGNAILSVSADIYNSPAFRFFCFIVLVLVTIWVIAKVYGGEIQGVEKGPIAIRTHGTNWPRDKIYLHRDIVPLPHDGLKAECSFYYVYEDAQHKTRRVLLHKANLTLGVEASRLQKKLGTINGTEIPDDLETLDVCFPTLDLVESSSPDIVQPTEKFAKAHVEKNRMLEKWSGDDSLSLVSVSPGLLETIAVQRMKFIEDRAGKVHAAREKLALKSSKKGTDQSPPMPNGIARKRPGAIGNYAIKFHFSNDPVFVLRKHPDRDVRMTAWLTVLTSLFALALEIFPLEPKANVVTQTALNAPAQQQSSTGQISTNDKAAQEPVVTLISQPTSGAAKPDHPVR